MIADTLRTTLNQYLGYTKTSPKGWHTRNCMLCHLAGESRDTRHRFGIKFASDGIGLHCFNCGFEARWCEGEEISHKFRIFLREIGVPNDIIQRLVFEAYKEKHSLGNPTEIAIVGKAQKAWKEISLPDNTMRMTEWLECGCDDSNLIRAADYAIGRKFHNLDELYWTPNTSMALHRRIILPFTYENKIVGYTARWIGQPPNKKVPKYINNIPKDYVYNLDNQTNDRRYVILIEGVFDARAVDGISTTNNEISKEQIEIINSLDREVIVCPDRDKAGYKFVKTAIQQNWAVSFPRWDDGIKDASQASEKYGRILTTQSIIESAETNKMKIELKWKMEGYSKHE